MPRTILSSSVAIGQMVALFILTFLATGRISAQSIADSYVQDTAYIDDMEPIPNQAESVKSERHSFTGPGPFTVHFKAEMTHKPSYYAWEIAKDDQFQILVDRFNTLEYDSLTSILDYEFAKHGSYYIRFTADFLDSDSRDPLTYSTADPYQVTISTSLLEVPNLITPDSPSGSNQVFKVKYQSLVSFEMWVFNRWGQQLFHTTDPSEGWDGKYNGSTVPTGAYYYVIKAQGTDDEEYVKKGAINVLKTKNSSTGRP